MPFRLGYFGRLYGTILLAHRLLQVRRGQRCPAGSEGWGASTIRLSLQIIDIDMRYV